MPRRAQPRRVHGGEEPCDDAGSVASGTIDKAHQGLPAGVAAQVVDNDARGRGPGAGHLIADLVSGAKPIFDPEPFNPGRFSKSAWGKVADF